MEKYFRRKGGNMRPIHDIFSNGNGEDKTPNKKKKAIKNDLLTGKRDEFADAKKTAEILKEHGFSIKTAKGVQGLNAQLRKDLK
jgi:hypothetical protein